MTKIPLKTPIVEMNGDEMTRIIWDMITDKLICPFVEENFVSCDLSLKNRERTGDRVTLDAAAAIKKYGVGVKCATITPNAQRVEEYKLSRMWKSPNGTIRAELDGTVFRAPILTSGVTPLVPGWKSPITIARHAYGDIYRAVEIAANAGERATLTSGESSEVVFSFDGPGVVMGMHNTDASILSFARSCMNYALSVKQDLWFSTKDTISKIYDHRFKDIFAETYESEYADRFKEAGISYFYTLIDDAVARVMRSSGGFIWACKNYDGDVMSDMVATAFGSLAMMTSVLVSPDGCYEYEAAHGTVTRHYYAHLRGEATSTNPVATIFAWTGALKKRGELDKNAALCDFADRLSATTLAVIESGRMTKDLSALWNKPGALTLTTNEFIDAIAAEL